MYYIIPTSEAMEQVGAQLATVCHSHCTIYLGGDLGVGKTTLVRGFLHALGHPGTVKSPTYTLVEPYQIGNHFIYHFDLYRLSHPEELEYLGIRDYLEENVICLIEWPERGGYITPPPDLEIQLYHHAEGRLLEWKAHTETGIAIVQRVGWN
jgi:tRNA threonylcarbamoyladenosine biosynthesis protein TsaE